MTAKPSRAARGRHLPSRHPMKKRRGGKMASQYYQEMQESFRNNNKSREFPAHTAKVHSVAWSCDGRRLASGSFDKTASVFILEKDRLVSEAAQCNACLTCFLLYYLMFL